MARHKHLRLHHPAGFTLVELVVVILILGILSFSIGPRFFSVNSYQDRRAIDELLTALRFTQQLAMNRGGNIQIIISGAPNNYRVERTVAPVDLRSPDGVFPFVKPLPDNIVINPSPTTIVFDALGRPVPNATQTFSIGSQQIRVEQETGYAHQL